MDTFRDFKRIDPDMFKQALQTVDWSEIDCVESPEEAFGVLVKKLEDLIDKTVPLRKC